jgi:hypothetical protein
MKHDFGVSVSSPHLFLLLMQASSKVKDAKYPLV